MLAPLKGFFKSKEQREWHRLLDQYENTEVFSPTTISFLSYLFQVVDARSFIWQVKDIFIDEVYKFESEWALPVIYDCGANIGVSTVYFKRIYPEAKVKAFEADPQLIKILESNLLSNGMTDVEIINKAVWINNSGTCFSSDGSDGGSIYGHRKKINIESLRLREWLEKESRIDFLKMDIEGAEDEVLNDCRDSLHHVRKIFIEYHSWKEREQKLGEILEIIRRNGFKYYLQTPGIIKNPFIRSGFNSKMDLQINIFAWKLSQ